MACKRRLALIGAASVIAGGGLITKRYYGFKSKYGKEIIDPSDLRCVQLLKYLHRYGVLLSFFFNFPELVITFSCQCH